MRKGFTLVELMIVIAIIGILTAMTMGALANVREMGREYATKATIAKLNTIIMHRYESYMHRRVPVDLSGLSPDNAAKDRLWAIRDLMRMEMPDRIADITAGPIALPNSGKSVTPPAAWKLYNNYYNVPAHKDSLESGAKNKLCTSAEMLYLCVSIGSPEDMEQFTQAEIGDTDGNGWLEFLDGWGRPIFFLRWAPGYSQYSDIQVPHPSPTTDDPMGHHDPFDPRRIDPDAYKLFPLIYSSGAMADPDLDNGATSASTAFSFAATPDMWNAGTSFTNMGKPTTGSGVGHITNHRIDAR